MCLDIWELNGCGRLVSKKYCRVLISIKETTSSVTYEIGCLYFPLGMESPTTVEVRRSTVQATLSLRGLNKPQRWLGRKNALHL
jgi:hypothetical protein